MSQTLDPLKSNRVTDGEFVDQAIRRGWIDFAKAQECRQIQSKPGHQHMPLHRILVERGYLKEEQAEEILGVRATAPSSPAAPSPPQEPELQSIGSYTIIEKLGTGSMGTVYRARKEGDTRDLAIKVFVPGFAKLASYIQRFKSQSKDFVKLVHPNLVKSVEFGVSQGRFFHSTEFVPGITLARAIEERGRMSEADALGVVGQVAAGLDALFQAGLMHGGIKAENIMLGADGIVRLMDTGEVKEALHDPAACSAAGLRFGSGRLLAPEQMLGKSDIRSDLFGLGAVMVHMLTGRRPTSGEAPDPRILRSDLTPAAGELIRSLLAPRPEDRLATPGAVAMKVRDILSMKPTLAQSVPAPKPLRPTRRAAPARETRRSRTQRRNRQLAVMGVTVALFVAGLLLILVLLPSRPAAPPTLQPASPPVSAEPARVPSSVPPAESSPGISTPPPPVPPPPKDEPLDKLFERVKASVVVISRNGAHSGSGFVLDADGHVMTNYHVVRGAKKIGVKIQVDLERGQTEVQSTEDAAVIAAEPKLDVAVLQVTKLTGKPRPAKIAHSILPRTGEPVFAIGHPGLGGTVLAHTLTQGIISSDSREIQGVTYIQTTAPVNPGNSGGPLFNMRGEVIGMVTLKAMFQESLGFALPMYHAIAVYRDREGKYKVEGPLQKWEAENFSAMPDRDSEDAGGDWPEKERTRGAFDDETRLYLNETLGARFEIPQGWQVYTRLRDAPPPLQGFRDADRPPLSEVVVAGILFRRMTWFCLIAERLGPSITAREYVALIKQARAENYRGMRNETIADRKFGNADGLEWAFELPAPTGDMRYHLAVFTYRGYACRLIVGGSVQRMGEGTADSRKLLDTLRCR